jgi:hypothetical protein
VGCGVVCWPKVKTPAISASSMPAIRNVPAREEFDARIRRWSTESRIPNVEAH